MMGCALVILVGGVVAQDGSFFRENQLGKSVTAARIVMVTNTVPTTVFTNIASRTEGRVLVRRLQNEGTGVVYYLLGSTNVSATNYHGILAAGTALANGTGGTVELNQWGGIVSALSASGTNNLATLEIKQ